MIIHLEGGGRFGNQIINLIHFTGGYFFHPELKIYSTQFLTYFGYLDLHKLLDKKYNKHRKPINRYQRVFLLRILPVLIINAHKFIPGFKLFITNDSMLKKKHFLFLTSFITIEANDSIIIYFIPAKKFKIDQAIAMSIPEHVVGPKV